ncbi:MAG: ATP-binding protein [Deltaproteobacteria bacterium]|nr:ATP-binding protein [Deltaproteobacteria bacterium]
MPKIKNIVAAVVRGHDFWGRETEIKFLTEMLEDGAHVSIVAQRRMGKTSLMREAGDRLQEKYLCLFLDVQDADGPADLIVRLTLATREHAGLWEKTKAVFGNTLRGLTDRVDSLNYGDLSITLRKDLAGRSWQQKGQQILKLLAQQDRPVVLFIDELPILLSKMLRGPEGQVSREGRREVEALLSWLRARSLEHQGKLIFVLAGSIGLEPVLNLAGLSANLNTFTPFILEAWDNPTALGCLAALAANYRLTLPPGVPEAMLALLGCFIPHHVQMFFHHLRSDCRHREMDACTGEDVSRVYRERMLRAQGQMSLAHMEERLTNNLPKELAALALDLLTQAAVMNRLTPGAIQALSRRHTSLENQTTNLAFLLGMLEHDGYLKPQGEDFVFVSHLLRDWWKARYGRLFHPVPVEG